MLNERAMKAAESLDHAADLLTMGWCRNVLARDADGFAVSPLSPHAVSWCAVGALSAVEHGVDNIYYVLEALRKHIKQYDLEFGGSIVLWNNNPSRTRAEVVDAFRLAAKGIREGRLLP